jgi:SAM-dependent methyltransferase
VRHAVTRDRHPEREARDVRRPVNCTLLEPIIEELPPNVFGMYPVQFIPKILPWLKCERAKLLHVCSGALPKGEGIRVDVRPEAKPDIVADGRKLPLEDGSIDAVLIDPPYTEEYARDLYGTDYPRPKHLLKEAARVVRPNGRIGIVHYIMPNPPEGCFFVKGFALSMGFGYPVRAVTIYERSQPALFAGEGPPPSPRQARRLRAMKRV